MGALNGDTLSAGEIGETLLRLEQQVWELRQRVRRVERAHQRADVVLEFVLGRTGFSSPEEVRSILHPRASGEDRLTRSAWPSAGLGRPDGGGEARPAQAGA